MRQCFLLMAVAAACSLAGSASADRVFYFHYNPRGIYYLDTSHSHRTLLSETDEPSRGQTIDVIHAIAVENANSLLVYGVTSSIPASRGIYRIDRTTGNRELVSGESPLGPQWNRGAAAVPSPLPNNFTSTGLGAIMVDPTNSNRLLVGSYDVGSLQVALDSGDRSWFTSAFTAPNFGTGDAPTYYQAHFYRNASSVYLYDYSSGIYSVELATGNRTRLVNNTDLPTQYIGFHGHALTPAVSGDVFYYATGDHENLPRLMRIDLASPEVSTVISQGDTFPTVGDGPGFSAGIQWLGCLSDGNVVAYAFDVTGNEGFMLIDVTTGDRSWLRLEVESLMTGTSNKAYIDNTHPQHAMVVERSSTSVTNWIED